MAKHESPLVEAATALDAELTRFEESTVAFQRLGLDSQKNLDRATKLLNDLAAAEATLGQKVQLLVTAINGVRDRQLAQVEAVKAKSVQIQERSAVFAGLLDQFQQLGKGAGALNEKLKPSGQPGANPIVDVQTEMTNLATRAEALATIAKDQDFDDLARQADGLRQQILAARNKLRQIETGTVS